MSWFSKLTGGLKKTTEHLSARIGALFTHKKIDAETLDALEEALIEGDLGVSVASRVVAHIRQERVLKDTSLEDIKRIMIQEIIDILSPYEKTITISPPLKKPFVILVVGVNGGGKTTTCAKMASQFQQQGLSVAIAACDTFRAAAIEQLSVWCDRLSIPIIRRDLGSDAAGLAFDACLEAQKKGYDVLLIDTAGRLHTNQNLMEELSKIERVVKKVDARFPHECLLVLDATIGQNAYAQVETFGRTVSLTGLVITKLDGTARGGVVVGLADKYKIPLCYIGVGETKDDLHTFKAADFSCALLGIPSGERV